MNSIPEPVAPDFSSVRFIYFDLDDTLIDHKNAQDRALVDVWTRYPLLQQLDPLVFSNGYAETNYRLWASYRRNEVNQSELRRLRFEETFKRLKVGPLDWREVDKAYMDCYQRHWDWIPDARKVFIRLSKKYPVGILTNGFTFVQKKKFEYFSLNRYTRQLIISEEVGFLKPDPRIFEYAAEKSGYKSAELLYVGDSCSSDIAGGAQCGWRTAWYNQSGHLPESCHSDFAFRNFNRLLEVL